MQNGQIRSYASAGDLSLGRSDVSLPTPGQARGSALESDGVHLVVGRAITAGAHALEVERTSDMALLVSLVVERVPDHIVFADVNLIASGSPSDSGQVVDISACQGP